MSKLEWDEEKNRKNLQKHGITFETAAEYIRLISARMAEESERELYFRWINGQR